MKRLAKWILWIIGISAGVILLVSIISVDDDSLAIIPIKEGKDLIFTNQYDKDALLMIPAAYTNEDGTIQGEYRIDGKIYGTPSRKERISLHPAKGIVISGSWHSGNGFQQTVLVKNGRARMHDDTRKRIRRALCNENSTGCSFMIVESATPMTLSDFAKELSKICYTAVNLDTGNYGYGWYGKLKFSRWAYYNKNKQMSFYYLHCKVMKAGVYERKNRN